MTTGIMIVQFQAASINHVSSSHIFEPFCNFFSGSSRVLAGRYFMAGDNFVACLFMLSVSDISFLIDNEDDGEVYSSSGLQNKTVTTAIENINK